MSLAGFSQAQVSGYVYDANQEPLNAVKVYDKDKGLLTQTNTKGYFEFETSKENLTLVFYAFEYQIKEVNINANTNTNFDHNFRKTLTRTF